MARPFPRSAHQRRVREGGITNKAIDRRIRKMGAQAASNAFATAYREFDSTASVTADDDGKLFRFVGTEPGTLDFPDVIENFRVLVINAGSAPLTLRSTDLIATL